MILLKEFEIKCFKFFKKYHCVGYCVGAVFAATWAPRAGSGQGPGGALEGQARRSSRARLEAQGFFQQSGSIALVSRASVVGIEHVRNRSYMTWLFKLSVLSAPAFFRKLAPRGATTREPKGRVRHKAGQEMKSFGHVQNVTRFVEILVLQFSGDAG